MPQETGVGRRTVKHDKAREAEPIKIISQIREADPKVQCGSDEWMGYALLFGSVYYGTDETCIATRLDLPVDRVNWMAENLRRTGIWRNGKLNLHPDDLTFAVCCAMGYMDKVSA